MLNVTQLRNMIETALINRDSWKHATFEEQTAFIDCVSQEDIREHADVDMRIYWKWFHVGWRKRQLTLIEKVNRAP